MGQTSIRTGVSEGEPMRRWMGANKTEMSATSGQSTSESESESKSELESEFEMIVIYDPSSPE